MVIEPGPGSLSSWGTSTPRVKNRVSSRTIVAFICWLFPGQRTSPLSAGAGRKIASDAPGVQAL